MNRLKCIGVFTVILFSIGTVFGQRTTASVSGSVKDASGAIVPGVRRRID